MRYRLSSFLAFSIGNSCLRGRLGVSFFLLSGSNCRIELLYRGTNISWRRASSGLNVLGMLQSRFDCRIVSDIRWLRFRPSNHVAQSSLVWTQGIESRLQI